MAAEDNSVGSLEYTPTWALAAVCFFFISISIIIEHSFHLLSNVSQLISYSSSSSRLLFSYLKNHKFNKNKKQLDAVAQEAQKNCFAWFSWKAPIRCTEKLLCICVGFWFYFILIYMIIIFLGFGFCCRIDASRIHITFLGGNSRLHS